MTTLFRHCPRRHQPEPSWIAFGAGVAVACWFVVTVALGASFALSHTFGDTYGPLAGLVGRADRTIDPQVIAKQWDRTQVR